MLRCAQASSLRLPRRSSLGRLAQHPIFSEFDAFTAPRCSAAIWISPRPRARTAIHEGPKHRMRGYVFDALAIDPDLTAVADRIPVSLSRADHRRSLSAL